MRYLLDTHLLLWSAGSVRNLSLAARTLIEDERNSLMFSAISIFEVAIKVGLARPDFRVDPTSFRTALLEFGFAELAFTSEHALSVQRLPALHKDPFDRALVAQAIAEQIELVTADKIVASYPGPIRKV